MTAEKFLRRNKNVVAQRIAFYACQKEFEDRCHEFIYVDETWVDTCYIVKKSWQGEKTPSVMVGWLIDS